MEKKAKKEQDLFDALRTGARILHEDAVVTATIFEGFEKSSVIYTKDQYIDIMFNAYWRDNLDIADEKILISLVESCKINPDQFLTAIKDPIIKDKLKDVTKDAHEKEIFGAPTFKINDQIFWGQDRLEYALDEYNK